MDGGQPSIQSDMYSLGVTLFELSFGRLPNLFREAGSRLGHSLSQQAIRFPDVWPITFRANGERILKRCWSATRKRYTTMAALLTELQATMPSSCKPQGFFSAVRFGYRLFSRQAGN
jgi:serine/threonine protein kinase